MIHGMAFNSSIPGLGALSTSAGGKISLPVEPAALIYSHFKNVSGVPAPEGSSGLTITKLNILDVLIEQMNQLKKAPAVSTGHISEDPLGAMLDAKIDTLKNQIQNAKEAHNSFSYVQAPSAETGSLFSLTL